MHVSLLTTYLQVVGSITMLTFGQLVPRLSSQLSLCLSCNLCGRIVSHKNVSTIIIASNKLTTVYSTDCHIFSWLFLWWHWRLPVQRKVKSFFFLFLLLLYLRPFFSIKYFLQITLFSFLLFPALIFLV